MRGRTIAAVDRLDGVLARLTATDAARAVCVSAPPGLGAPALMAALAETSARDVVHVGCPPVEPAPSLEAVRTALGHDGDEATLDRSALSTMALDRLCATPTLLLVEGADHLDEASESLLSEVVTLPECDVMIVVTVESPSGCTGSRFGVTDWQSIALASVSRDEGEAIAGRSLSDEEWSRSDGNPTALAMLAGATESDPRLIVLSRFDALSADGQDLAAMLACTPEGLEPSAIERLDRTAAGRELEADGLVLERDGRLRIAEEVIRRIIHADLTDIRRRILHGRIASTLAEIAAPERVARHAALAGDVTLLVAVGPKAARTAARNGSRREAVAHARAVLAFEHSLPPDDRAELRAIVDG